MNILKGYRTYIGCIAYAIAGILHTAHKIDQPTFDTLSTLIISLTGVALRSALTPTTK